MAATELSNEGGPPPGELHDATAVELLALYARKALSPVEVAEAVLTRIDALNPRLNCFVAVDAERTLQDARASEARWHQGTPCGALDGVPVSVKDLLLTAGWPTRKGSLTVPADGPWEEDAPSVARLREHGAVLLGKTSTPEYGHKGTTSSILCGVTRNPWNPDLTPGRIVGGAPERRSRGGWARSRSARTGAARCASRRASPASSATSPRLVGFRRGRCHCLGRWRTWARWPER